MRRVKLQFRVSELLICIQSIPFPSKNTELTCFIKIFVLVIPITIHNEISHDSGLGGPSPQSVFILLLALSNQSEGVLLHAIRQQWTRTNPIPKTSDTLKVSGELYHPNAVPFCWANSVNFRFIFQYLHNKLPCQLIHMIRYCGLFVLLSYPMRQKPSLKVKTTPTEQHVIMNKI